MEEAAAETIEANVAAAAAAAASAPSPDGRDLLAGADVARWAGSVGVASPASAADESPRLEGARRTARWRAVVRQLALASLQRIQADAALAMDEADEAKDSTAAAAAADAEPRVRRRRRRRLLLLRCRTRRVDQRCDPRRSGRTSSSSPST